MELRDALVQIEEIRQQVARTRTCRSFRAVPVAASGLLAFITAALQKTWIADPASDLNSYLALWIGTAVVSVIIMAIEIAVRSYNSESPLGLATTWLTVEQFVPCLAAGAALTLAISYADPTCAWMLPGLWQVTFSMGIFSIYRLLPTATFWVAIFYLFTGAGCLAFGKTLGAMTPWVMGLPFGVGQLFAAALLYWTLERNDDQAN